MWLGLEKHMVISKEKNKYRQSKLHSRDVYKLRYLFRMFRIYFYSRWSITFKQEDNIEFASQSFLFRTKDN